MKAHVLKTGSCAEPFPSRRYGAGRAAIGAGGTLVLETTLAGKAMFRIFNEARKAGYRIKLHYVSVGAPAVALDRISNRGALGGHGVPEADVNRRFTRSLANLPAAIARSDEARLYDNCNSDEPYREVAVLAGTTRRFSENLPRWVRAVVQMHDWRN